MMNAPFHGIHDRNMHRRVASGAEPLHFSFRTRPPLGVTENPAMVFMVDMVSIRQELVRFFKYVRRKRLAGSIPGEKKVPTMPPIVLG